MLHILSKFCLRESSDSTHYSSGEIRTDSDVLDSEFYHSCIAGGFFGAFYLVSSFILADHF